jgi:hypothetical protein
VKVQFIVPAGDGQLKHVINKFEKIRNPVGGKVGLLSLILNRVEVVLTLLDDDAQDDSLEVFKTDTHV